ncbi:MAG: hypothetical protein JW841_12260 [Deltaproteobacteria bacterium]|nr:hypothetical protein [Deltaproteobacteria bacterium]
MKNETQIAVRIPHDLLERADKLVKPMSKRADLRVWGGKVSRSNVLRLALLKGLEVLEKETASLEEQKQENK